MEPGISIKCALTESSRRYASGRPMHPVEPPQGGYRSGGSPCFGGRGLLELKSPCTVQGVGVQPLRRTGRQGGVGSRFANPPGGPCVWSVSGVGLSPSARKAGGVGVCRWLVPICAPTRPHSSSCRFLLHF